MPTPSVSEFFLRVVPWPSNDESGYINLHWKSPKLGFGFGGRPYRKFIDFMDGVERAKNNPAYATDIYFCLSRQSETKTLQGRTYALRRKLNALAIKCIVLDVDIKKTGYVDLTDAIQALVKFCNDAQLPRPTAIVHSGGGLHIYWISDRALTIEEWTSYANGLHSLAKQHGLRFDPSVTIDCARVLRVPSTHNYKTTELREVKLFRLTTADLNFERELGHIKLNSAPPAIRASSIGQSQSEWDWVRLPFKQSKPELFTAEYQAEIGAIRPLEELNMRPAVGVKGCPLLRESMRTGGKKQNQGVWMLTGLACTFVKDGRNIFHTLSKGHVGYTPLETDEMFDRKETEQEEQGLGWPSCLAFEGMGAQECAECPHRGKIKSPLNLMAPAALDPKVEAPNPSASLSINENLPLRPPYYVDPANGYISMEVFRTIGKQIETEVISLMDYKVKEAWTEADRGINLVIDLKKDGLKNVILTHDDLHSDQAFGKKMASYGAHPNEPLKNLRKCIVALINDLRARQKSRESVAYGWHKVDGNTIGWAYNGIIRTNDGATPLPSSLGDTETRKLYTPKGDVEIWKKALKLVTDQHRPDIEVIAAAAFASPLLHFTGHYSGALVGTSQSGGNKSTAVNVGAAVWGNPKKTKMVSSGSQVGIRIKMAELNNFPCYWDDVRAPDMPKAGAAVHDLSQGVDGVKAKQDRSLHKTGDWQAMLIICSNASIFDHYVTEYKSDAAGLYRIFEFKVSKKETAKGGRISEREATYMQQQLEDNYGIIGDKYSFILADTKLMLELVNKMHDDLAKELDYIGQEQERFWMAIVTTIMVGAKLANSVGASFNLHEMREFLVKAYKDMREKLGAGAVIGTDKAATEAALTAFMKNCADNTLRTEDKPSKGPGQKTKFISGPRDGSQVHIHWVTKEESATFTSFKTRACKLFER